MNYVGSASIKTSQDLFKVFEQNNILIIATEYFDSISQLMAAYHNRNNYNDNVRNEIERICNLTIE